MSDEDLLEELDMTEEIVDPDTSGGSYFCPFCAGSHSFSISECSKLQRPIPSAYIDAQARAVPTVTMLTIGYRSHGKTCFLSGLMHYLYHGPPAKQWRGFTFLGLTQETLNLIHDEYVNVLDAGGLPPRTATVFPEPLVLQFDNMPLARKFLGLKRYAPSELITIFYDVGGEVYKSEDTIKRNLPVIQATEQLVFLVDLSLLDAKSADGGSAVGQALHALLNTVFNAISSLGAKGRKGILICFTKADLLWDKEGFGPLSDRSVLELPALKDFRAYSRWMEHRSDEIGEFIRRNYTLFYNALSTHFEPVRFAAVSALGESPENENVGVLRPTSIMDPLFWCLKMDGRF